MNAKEKARCRDPQLFRWIEKTTLSGVEWNGILYCGILQCKSKCGKDEMALLLTAYRLV